MSLSNHLSQHAEHLIIGVANKTVIAGTTTSVGTAAISKTEALGFLSMNGPEILNACAIVGAILAFAGFIVSTYFQRRRDKRDEEHKQLLIKLQTGAFEAVRVPGDE